MLDPARRVILVFAGAAIYLALTLLAWGNIAAFFAQPALAAVVAVFIFLTLVGLFAGGSLSAGIREDRGILRQRKFVRTDGTIKAFKTRQPQAVGLDFADHPRPRQ